MDAINILDKLKTADKTSFNVNAKKQKCYDALNDDFNTPILIAHLFEAVKFINQINDGKATITKADLENLKTALNALSFDVLGLITGVSVPLHCSFS
jgi:cysteinyl-tRNA synthetase